MRKKILSVALIAVLLMGFTACGGGSTSIVDDVKRQVATMIKGNIKGETGKTYGTQWFEFTIDSIKAVDSYSGYSAEKGYRLIDVLVTEKCTFDQAIPMGTFDFYMDSKDFEDYIYPINPLDDTMMPEEFDLAPGETVSYHMVYEIPEHAPDLKLIYTEWDEEEKEGATFTIDVKL